MLRLLHLFEKLERIVKKAWKYLLVQVLKIEIKETRVINGISLIINTLETGGNAYFSTGSYKESANLFCNLVQNQCNPTIVLDIGANYGFTSVLFSKAFKNAEVISVEPSSELCKYIQYNKDLNSCTNIKILRAICDQDSGLNKSFSLNPLYSQDNRVNAPSSFWKTEKVITTSIDTILSNHAVDEYVYIKIDTQGFEKSVFYGASQFLKSSSKWLIKTEFSPFSLREQGTNPKEFLEYLITNYDVVENVGNLHFKEKSISNLFTNKLTINDVDEFLNYLLKLDHRDIGWVDLLIKSKQNDFVL